MNMQLPHQQDLPVQLLAAVFNNTSATYKFYWFLAIVNRIEQGEERISKRHLFADMVAHSWFTVNYFHVSFGKQDKLQQAIEKIRPATGLTVDTDRQQIFTILAQSSDRAIIRELWYFNSEVPHRFLSPWFKADNAPFAYEQSQRFTNQCPYAVYPGEIIVNPEWLNYLRKNAGILKAFCYWHLAVYLQNRNPSIPDIPNKLIKIPGRKNLTEQRKFWDIVIGELGGVDCIYTNSRLTTKRYAVEHFIPYAFVSHDLIWNLIPADPAFNSIKSDRLPILEKYFDPFYTLQKQAIEIILHKAPKNKLLQDYLTMFPLFDSQPIGRKHFLAQIQPLVKIAGNNGFEFMRT